MPSRYDPMVYNRCGRSGLKLPLISLGLWHNFGGVDDFSAGRAMIRRAFDMGITHFDLANNYGPPPGSAEISFGRILRKDLAAHRDEMIVSTKAGYTMWAGPYGDWGSRKHLLSSLDQSLKRLGLGYVDVFYSHRFDPETPLEETLSALTQAVRLGKALYAGISNYPPAETESAARILRSEGTPCLIHQVRYSMFAREPENGLLDVLEREGLGCIAFSPLAQGLLSGRYLNGIPEGSRASKAHGFLKPADITGEKTARIRKLNGIAKKRGQTLSQMALAWVLRGKRVTSVLVGASRVEQLEENAAMLGNLKLENEELDAIDGILR